MLMPIGSVLHLLNLQTLVVALIRAACESVKDCIDKVHFLCLFLPTVSFCLLKRPQKFAPRKGAWSIRDLQFGASPLLGIRVANPRHGISINYQ
jgi:hypothetical protein